MRRIIALTTGIIMLGFIMVTKATAGDSKKEVSVDAAEQVILDLLYQPTIKSDIITCSQVVSSPITSQMLTNKQKICISR